MFKKKWKITEKDLEPENQRKIIQENKAIFEKLQEKYLHLI